MAVQLYYNLYNVTLRVPQTLKKLYIDSLFRYMVVAIGNVFFPIHFRRTIEKYCLNPNQPLLHNRQIIVSLTSFPLRIGVVWMVVESLMRQTMKPHRIILWLSKEQFSSLDVLPKKLIEQCGRGLEIRIEDGDIRSHKKYAYAFKEFPNDYVILIDDDILYPENFISELLIDMDKNDRVNCSYGAIMKYNIMNELLPYEEWPIFIEKNIDIKSFFFGTGGGTAFIPSMLHKDTCNMELAYKLCPLADDVWLNAMCRLSGIKCVKVRGQLIPPIIIDNNDTLCSKNVGQSLNDVQIEKVRSYYKSRLNIDPYGYSE